VSAQLTSRALAEAGEARTAANCPAFPLELPRWSGNWRQRAYDSPEFVFKMEIPAESPRISTANIVLSLSWRHRGV
jgi:hypothetical protein